MGINELVHLNDGTEGSICGEKLSDTGKLISKGKSILIENNIISRIDDNEVLIEEFLPSFKKIEGEFVKNEVTSINIENLKITHVGGNSIIPGLIDSHTHLIWDGDRSNEVAMRMKGMTYAEISEAGGGIAYTVNKTRNSSDEQLIKLGKIRLNEALRNGTTALEAKSGYGLNTESELRLLSIMNDLASFTKSPSIDITWMGAHDIPPGKESKEHRKTEYIDNILNSQIPEVVEQGYARSCDVFCEPGWYGIDETEEIIDAATNAGLAARLHIDEFKDGGGGDLAAKKGVETADHALYSNRESREMMAKSNVNQGFLPGAPFTMGLNEWPPIKYCIENNQPWTIATDFNPNCKILSLPTIASICVQRLRVEPLAVLCGVTRNASQTVIHQTETPHGMLKEGYVANMNIVNGNKWEGWCLQLGSSPFKATILEGDIVKHTIVN
tara:strand:- start:6 stop:1331 length:1326 start_codon:yes stop_codon:yes gene_type:complete